jgi:membrane glycosyltransferase
LRARLLREGPLALEPRDKLALLLDGESMTRLHRELWATPAADLAPEWRAMLARPPAANEGPEEFSINDAMVVVK